MRLFCLHRRGISKLRKKDSCTTIDDDAITDAMGSRNQLETSAFWPLLSHEPQRRDHVDSGRQERANVGYRGLRGGFKLALARRTDDRLELTHPN
jgi:hypothetical protein